MRILSLANGKVLDVFLVHDAHSSTGAVSDRQEKLMTMIEPSVSGEIGLSDELAKRGTTLAGAPRPCPPRRV